LVMGALRGVGADADQADPRVHALGHLRQALSRGGGADESDAHGPARAADPRHVVLLAPPAAPGRLPAVSGRVTRRPSGCSTREYPARGPPPARGTACRVGPLYPGSRAPRARRTRARSPRASGAGSPPG